MVNTDGVYFRSTVRSWWTTVSKRGVDFREYSPIREVLEAHGKENDRTFWEDLNLYEKLSKYLDIKSYGMVEAVEGNSVLDTAEQYSAIYQSTNLNYSDHCVRQAKALQIYYGDSLQMPVDDLNSLCRRHIHGLSLMGDGKLFAIKSGIFGTMPLSATGTNDYSDWVQYEAEIYPFLFDCVFSTGDNCEPAIKRPTFDPENYDGVVSDPDHLSLADKITNRTSFVMPSPENYLGKRRHCDYSPAPNRLIVNAGDLTVVAAERLKRDSEQESCKSGVLAQLLLGGYHPNQISVTHFSSAGHGPNGDRKAVYVMAEIGQEKQLDLMLEYLNLPELYPLTSSASLSMVRLLIDPSTGDVDPNSIVAANPFKYTWVASPLNRFGRLDKTGSQEQVPYLPKPVKILEDESFVYFFYREVDWEATHTEPYSVRRYHFRLNSYSRALYFPWEKQLLPETNIQHEEEPGNTYEELYAPNYNVWKHINSNLRLTGRVARVCKNDAGLSMGVQDANLFDLDHKLSLSTFQTFIKSKITCKVPVAGKLALTLPLPSSYHHTSVKPNAR